MNKPFSCKIGLHSYYIIVEGATTEKIKCKKCFKTRIVPKGWPFQL